ncbi:asparagine synthase (glutamine-hydrolyzing) [Mucilaginibacter glaciei]|uniref:asparagine synthase (glutamine-hydrolyzing) n=1 Tax=Mucilaginibacter glaciei TaxID=2772109 RepID=A0A926NS33_9SPHI|nr:asparagine synthase (glutamine-hydrolyzing) [Mucilaginibacter glaciei]MBD1392910.1 asparagine synthase (glutamine-hydrolyzing) [Mucilaginibacter glaciei]
MCRIAGLVSNQLNIDQIKSQVKAMCNALQHGGPDDEGVQEFVNDRMALGHRRLSIIDLSKNGHQPMADVAQKTWITFNGEIYNYRELRTELTALGAKFHSETDTEVIIQGYLHWGTACFEKLRGMFAFALYDSAHHAVYLVRDSNGIKPLYYFIRDGQLAFASEIKAFEAAGLTTAKNKRWPIWLLAFGNIPEPYTTLKDTFSLPKGSYMCWDKDGGYFIKSYIQQTPKHTITSITEAHDGLHFHLQNAVKRQLIADAPIGVFLSGGVDSSLLTLLANAQTQQRLKTISIFFDEKKYDERSYQLAILNKTESDNYSHLVKKHDFEECFPQIMSAMDMPTTDGINSWFISKYAHDAGLKAVLSGIGADELFGGYPSFNRISYLRYLRALPAFVFDSAGFLNTTIYKRLTYLKYAHPAADYLFIRGLNTPVDIANLLDTTEQEVNNVLFGENNFPQLGPYDKLQAAWFETNLYMQNQLLRDTDVMSMSHGLEVRVPFLDEDFQSFTAQISPEIRFDSTRPKKILIDTFNSLLPETIWNRPKMGFSFPLEDWMRGNNSIGDSSQYKGTAAQKLINKFKAGKVHWSRAFALYQIQKYV